ncbi:MAG: hypothetical protein ACRES5_34285 [Pseudomonas sp.]
MLTAIQICTLIALFAFIGITYWAGYRGGLIDGRTEECSTNIAAIELLEQKAHKLQYDLKKARQLNERAIEATKLGEPERQALLEIAEKLRIAAETFSAFKTGKKLERESLALRDRALQIAALLEQTEQEAAA